MVLNQAINKKDLFALSITSYVGRIIIICFFN